MNDRRILARLGYVALGVAACVNAVLAAMLLVTGELVSAKLIAAGFGVMAATELAAADFVRRRIRTPFVPITCALTLVGECAFSIYLVSTT